jgi:hypothetical protein
VRKPLIIDRAHKEEIDRLEGKILDMQRNPSNPANVSIRTIPEISENGMEEKRENSPLNTERSLQMNIQINREDVSIKDLQ